MAPPAPTESLAAKRYCLWWFDGRSGAARGEWERVRGYAPLPLERARKIVAQQGRWFTIEEEGVTPPPPPAVPPARTLRR